MTEFSKESRTLRGAIVFAFALALAAYVAWVVRGVLLLLYVSALFAVVLAPVVEATAGLHVGRWRPFQGKRAIFFLLLAAAAALTGFGFLAIPPVVRDLAQFSTQAPASVPEMLSKLQQIPLVNRLDGGELTSRLEGLASHAAAYVLLSIKDWAGGLANVIMGFILTVYFILEGDRAYAWFLSFFPLRRRERLDKALQQARVRMGKWLLGQGSLMLILGVTSTVVFVALRVRYAYALGVLAGLLNLVPVLGSAITVVLALLVAALDSWGRAIGVAVFFAIYIQIENSYLIPRIMKTRVDLSGLAILVSLLLGFALAGILGAMVAVPTAVLVTVLLDEYLVWKET